MDAYWDVDELSEEEKERLRRRMVKREQMQREKRMQMRRRKKIRRMMVLGGYAGVFLLFLSLAIGLSVKVIKAKKEIKANQELIQTIHNDGVNAEENQQEEISEEIVLNDNEKGNHIELSAENTGVTKEDIYHSMGAGLGQSFPEAKRIEFQDAADKKGIYSEEVLSSNAILVQEGSNTVVAGKGEKERISPASMTKVLTILVAAENISESQLEDTFTMTREVTDYGYVNDCSYVGFVDGEQVKVRDLFYGTILQSGADAAVGLATYVSGSHEAFVEKMNDKLKELGIGDTTHFTNCVGVYDEDHYSTAYDMAVIMKAALSNDFCKKVMSERTYLTEKTEQNPEGISISNWFIRRIEDKDTGGTVLAAKTGYVNQSKNCAVSYGEFGNGTGYICVTVGASSSWRCIYDHVEIYNTYVSR